MIYLHNIYKFYFFYQLLNESLNDSRKKFDNIRSYFFLFGKKDREQFIALNIIIIIIFLGISILMNPWAKKAGRGTRNRSSRIKRIFTRFARRRKSHVVHKPKPRTGAFDHV